VPVKDPPSWRWFALWLNKVLTLHTIKTKPIAYKHVESYTKKDMKRWYTDKYRVTLTKYRITKPKRVLNIDKIGC